jgi:hypothetical protein
MKILKRGSMVKEHRQQQASAKVEDSWKAPAHIFEIF